ncbi:conserved Plasmodium protein, unknown function [Plasmodium gallinaceum]|uniref:Uncharacterized protein n=1 Tax=Plasmodium gallinaceum TaxID=5849 RepID=A0A1J1GW45_PLAGA|nr:conserved Plasmodium protein, unknown function [Plasmodium gallinaceum]CRG96486.1 conserved Plasmodium protein, unknown function [Plasmodium gallinaceum]
MNNTNEHTSESNYTPNYKCNDLSEVSSYKDENVRVLSKEMIIDKYNIKLNNDKKYDIKNRILDNEEIISDKIKNINNKKNSIDFESLNESIFNININLNEKDEEYESKEDNNEVDEQYEDKEDNDEVDEEYENDNESKDKNEEETKNKRNDKNDYIKKREDIKKEKIKNSNNYNNNEYSSYNSLDEVNQILKIKNRNILEKKNRYTYILQHKKRIRDKKKEKINIEKINNHLKSNYLKINKTSKENVKRASVATIMLEKFSNSDTEYSDDNSYDSKN